MFVTGWFKIVVRFIRSIWGDIIPIINNYIIPAIRMVNAIKQAMKENGSDEKLRQLLKKIFKDDNAVDAAIDTIAKAIKVLNLSAECLEKKTPQEVLACFITQVKDLPKFQQRAIWRELSKNIAIINNGDIAKTESDKLDFAIQLAYSLDKNKPA